MGGSSRWVEVVRRQDKNMEILRFKETSIWQNT